MNGIKRYLVLPNRNKDVEYAVTIELVQTLRNRGAVVMFADDDKDLATRFGCCTLSEREDDPECLIVVGGDGTVIDAANVAVKWNVPLVGVNMGRLGFLAEMECNDFAWLEKLIGGEYGVTERMLLTLEMQSENGERTIVNRSALNEVCLRAAYATGLADVTLTDNVGNEIRYRGDGLILATPSGSTAYSFSAGGPIIDPTLDAICVTPICPHSFFNRAMVLGPKTIIDVTNTSRKNKLQVSIDGRDVLAIDFGEKITVAMAQNRLKMITFGDIPTFTTLRRKMELAEMKD